jgi:hypothetical protein
MKNEKFTPLDFGCAITITARIAVRGGLFLGHHKPWLCFVFNHCFVPFPFL